MNNISRRALHGIYFRTKNAAVRPDRLSQLPDDILVNILERVGTLDALRTCILSKRFLRLPAMLSRFDIDIRSLMDLDAKVLYHIGSLMDLDVEVFDNSLSTTDVPRCNNAVAAVTEKILSARSPDAPIVRKLRVTCFLRPDECLPITRAFASVMVAQQVDHAELVLLVDKPISGFRSSKEFLCYAARLHTCLADCPAAFAGLTRLSLRSITFGELDIPSILTTCKRLEYLRLSVCFGVHLRVLQVDHDQLVELVLGCCLFEEVHLNRVPKLQHLTFTSCWFSSLTFGYAPRLSNLSLGKRCLNVTTTSIQLSGVLANAPSITHLHLDFYSEQIWVVPEHPKLLAPVLRNLEIVNLDNLPDGCDIAWTMFILEAAPSLRELCITVWDHWCAMVTDQDLRRQHGLCERASVEWQPSASAGFKHKNLVMLTIYGFQPDENFVRYVRRIMEVAVNMREISLHDRKAFECCRYMDSKMKACPSTYPTTGEEKDMLRVEMTKGLGMAASPAVIRFRS